MKFTYYRNTYNETDALEILPIIFKLIEPNSIVDVGCGRGTWLNVAKKMGVAKIRGIEGHLVSKKDLLINQDEIIVHDLNYAYKENETYDLAICLEVVEHLEENSAKTIIETLVNLSDLILFSAAIPEQGGDGHINEKWPQYWQKLFSDHNYVMADCLRMKLWENPNVKSFYKQNIFLVGKEQVLKKLRIDFSKPIYSIVHPEMYLFKNNNYNKKVLPVINGEIGVELALTVLKNAIWKKFKKIF